MVKATLRHYGLRVFQNNESSPSKTRKNTQIRENINIVAGKLSQLMYKKLEITRTSYMGKELG